MRARRGRPDGGRGASAPVDLPDPAAELRGRLSVARHEHLVPMRLLVGPEPSLAPTAVPELGLPEVLATAGSLRPGEVVTVLVPVARALGALHAQGCAVVEVQAGDVRLDLSGRPSLACRRVPVLASVGSLDGDVRSLAGLAWALLTGSDPQPGDLLPDLVPEIPVALAALVTAVLDAPDAALPSADEFADALFASCPAEPVRLPPLAPADASTTPRLPDVAALRFAAARGSAPVGRPGPPPRTSPRTVRRPRRASGGRARRPKGRRRVEREVAWAMRPGIVALLLGIVLCLLLVLVLRPRVLPAGASETTIVARATAPATATSPASAAVFGGSAPAAQPPTLRPSPAVQKPAPGWAGILGGLDERRSRALMTGDAALLRSVYADRSPAGARDGALLTAYVSAGVRVVGLRSQVRAVQARRATAEEVLLELHDRVPAYALVGTGGARRRVDARGDRTWLVELRRERAQWRIWEVSAA